MDARVLIPSAGSVASNNLIRSLKTGASSLHIVACGHNRFALKRSLADRNYIVPSAHADLVRTLNRLIRAERIDLVIPNSEADVRQISSVRKHLECRTFLPATRMIERCSDKLVLNRFLRMRGIPAPETYAVDRIQDIDRVFRRLAAHDQMWCRIRRGTGSIGAIPVRSADQARWWISYWEDMRNVPPGMFTLSEYLPGRDITVQCLFKQGALIMSKMLQRLSYNVIGGGPSGVSSTASLGLMLFEPRIVKICLKAITALDPKASGAYAIDVKERADGTPCITEINAGRFANGPIVHDLGGEPNTAITYVRLALGERMKPVKARPYPEDSFILRHLDIAPAVLRASDLLDGIEEIRARSHRKAVTGPAGAARAKRRSRR